MKEQNTYQKLFNINYNNKIFTIFIDMYGRRTFLEFNDSKYKYPNIDDFINLHKIYNERNPFILYYLIGDKLPVHKPKIVKFKEKVLNTTGVISIILTGTIAISSLINSFYKIEQNEDSVNIISSYSSDYFDNSNELDNYLGTSIVSHEELIKAIKDNDNLSESYKESAIKLADYIKYKYPNTDNRIFYDNIKTLKVEVLDNEDDNKNIAGAYNCFLNVISVKKSNNENNSNMDNNFLENEVAMHELYHVYHSWANNNESDKYVCRTSTIGHSLEEAMTNKVIGNLIKDGTNTYQREGKILDYLLACVDYNYYDYEKGGINKLYSLLKDKYPDVDIDYIFNFTDTMCNSSLYLGNYIKIEEEVDFLNCLFDLCIRNIDDSDIYESLVNFIKLIDINNYSNVVIKYIDEYNNVLKDNNYSDRIINKDDLIVYINKILNKESYDKYIDDISSYNIIDDGIYKSK